MFSTTIISIVLSNELRVYVHCQTNEVVTEKRLASL